MYVKIKVSVFKKPSYITLSLHAQIILTDVLIISLIFYLCAYGKKELCVNHCGEGKHFARQHVPIVTT